VASPPYAITADLLDLLLAAGTRLVAADLVLQRAVVRKYAGLPGQPGQPGQSGQSSQAAAAPAAARQPRPRQPHRLYRAYRMSAGLVLPRHAFRPPPRVDSAVLIIRRR
jgi:23S rRNA (adenine-N6)-dimethyltransferase